MPNKRPRWLPQRARAYAWYEKKFKGSSREVLSRTHQTQRLSFVGSAGNLAFGFGVGRGDGYTQRAGMFLLSMLWFPLKDGCRER